ncbi:MAG: HD domain-containing protein [Ardenticatenaceae bacterium]|nr:HD domain-containing protein [Anaerolineales bacterium]MCB8922613.1 HD domain-containing protein [Ardenticatenaceae bacterium]MCB8991281.1 HD domain-containing protein [Ardenticatenaceae bacterium]MCB9003678.1 HD domain-containing protein [Ardenticatenaceae bacterium]
MGLAYRVGQFWRLLAASPLAVEAQLVVTAVLNPTQQQLFARFTPGDQWHSYQVLRTLEEAGHTHPDLQVAALLHDIGKTQARLTLWGRTLIVLTQHFFSAQLAVWGQGTAQGWKRPFVIKAQHPAWGADMAAAAGCSPLAVSLIRRHQDVVPETAVSEEDTLLRLLQWADDQN